MPLATWALGELAVELSSWAVEPGAGVDAIVAPVIVGLGAVICGYLTLSAIAMVGAALTGAIPDWIAVLAPTAWRRVVATAAGVTLSAGIAVPALAADIAPGWTAAVVTAGVDSAPGWDASTTRTRVRGATDALPGWIDGPSVSSTSDEPTTAPAEAAQTPTWEVAPGESLWKITATVIDDQDPAHVASAWPLLYEANRKAIGDDPSLIFPDQVLEIPSELAR